MSGVYFHSLRQMRETYRSYRGWCLRKGYRWMPYRRWLVEQHAACWIGHACWAGETCWTP